MWYLLLFLNDYIYAYVCKPIGVPIMYHRTESHIIVSRLLMVNICKSLHTFHFYDVKVYIPCLNYYS